MSNLALAKPRSIEQSEQDKAHGHADLSEIPHAAPLVSAILEASNRGDCSEIDALLREPDAASLGAQLTTTFSLLADSETLNGCSPEIFARLQAGGGDVSLERGGITPIASAILRRHFTLASFLIDAGVDLDQALPPDNAEHCLVCLALPMLGEQAQTPEHCRFVDHWLSAGGPVQGTTQQRQQFEQRYQERCATDSAQSGVTSAGARPGRTEQPDDLTPRQASLERSIYTAAVQGNCVTLGQYLSASDFDIPSGRLRALFELLDIDDNHEGCSPDLYRLIQQRGGDVTFEHGVSSLVESALRDRNFELAEFLVEAGAALNAFPVQDGTAACDICQALPISRIDPNPRPNCAYIARWLDAGRIVSESATQRQHFYERYETLCPAKQHAQPNPNPSSQAETPDSENTERANTSEPGGSKEPFSELGIVINMAADRADCEILYRILSNPSVETDADEMRPLFYFLSRNTLTDACNDSLFKQIKNRGGDPSYIEGSSTPLVHAVMERNFGLGRYLIEAGADLHHKPSLATGNEVLENCLICMAVPFEGVDTNPDENCAFIGAWFEAGGPLLVEGARREDYVDQIAEVCPDLPAIR